MIIVSGKLHIRPGQRSVFLEASLDAVRQARAVAGCQDFVVAADPVESDRVNIYEEWESAAQLEAFRGSGPDGTLTELILRADVKQRRIPSDQA